MLYYERMTIMMPDNREFVYCGNITLEQLGDALFQAFEAKGIPVAFKRDKVKSGVLSTDPCLVLYNPCNLDYHVYVFVLRVVNGRNMLSYYSAGTASALHIGGGITNVDNLKTKGLGLLKSAKQKDAEEQEYLGLSSIACDDAMIALGVFRNEDFSYRRR